MSMRRNVLKRTLSEDIIWASVISEAYTINLNQPNLRMGTVKSEARDKPRTRSLNSTPERK
jgi:hypothetical protein